MLLTTGKKEELSVSRGSEIEVSAANEGGNVWYRAILGENLGKSKRKKLSVRHLDPLLKKDYSPPLIKATFHRHIRPVPPLDLLTSLDFAEGDVVDAAYKGGWCSGSVIRVLDNRRRRYLVSLRSEPHVMEFDRKDLRPHFVWKDEEWFQWEKRELGKSEFSAGTEVEVRREMEDLGDIWSPAIAIKENGDGTLLLVKLKPLKAEQEDDCAKIISLPFSKIRPSPPPFGSGGDYELTQNVEALVESGWCPAEVSTIKSGNRYTVLLGRNKESKVVSPMQLRPSLEWHNGVWLSQGKVLEGQEKSPHAPQQTPASTRIRVTVPSASKDQKTISGTKMNTRATRSSTAAMQQSPLPAFSNGGDVAEAGRASAVASETPHSKTAAQLHGESGSTTANAVIIDNTPDKSEPEIASAKEFHPAVVLGVAATLVSKPAAKTKGKTSPRKKLQAMTNQNGSANGSDGEKAPEETRKRESVNKRKRGQPRVVGNGSNAPDTTDDDQPLASWIHGGNSSSGQSASRTPDPMLNPVVEKHVDVVETSSVRASTMVLPFTKKSPLWKVIDSMDAFKAVPQHPHFSPLVETDEESREGDAIGAMVKFTGMLDRLNNIQVDDPVSLIERMREGFLKLEKLGFNVTEPRSRLSKLLSIKDSQTWALEELKAVEREITEKDNKRRKCEEDIEDLSRKNVELKKAKVALDKEIAVMQSRAAVLDHKVQNVEQDFRATASAPWK